jgi:flagellar biosynthesis protein FliQ
MEQKSTFWKTAMIYGLYVGILVVLYSVILYVTGQMQNKTLAYLPLVIYAVCIVLAQISYRDHELNGVISYGQAVGFGVAVMLFSGIIAALYNLIIFKIDPSLIEQIKIAQEEAYLSSGMSEDQIEKTMEMAAKMMTPGWMAIMGLFAAVFMGTIISLVTSIFVKRLPNKDAFDEAMEDVKTEE